MGQYVKRSCWWCGTALMKIGQRTLPDGRIVHAKCEFFAVREVKLETKPYSAIPPNTAWGKERGGYE